MGYNQDSGTNRTRTRVPWPLFNSLHRRWGKLNFSLCNEHPLEKNKLCFTHTLSLVRRSAKTRIYTSDMSKTFASLTKYSGDVLDNSSLERENIRTSFCMFIFFFNRRELSFISIWRTCSGTLLGQVEVRGGSYVDSTSPSYQGR